MWLRALSFFLLLYLLLNLPFFTLKQYRKRVYLYKNTAAKSFLQRHPEIEKFVHLTKNPRLHPIFLVAERKKNIPHGEFDYIYITQKNNPEEFLNSIPTHAYIKDTVTIKIPHKKNVVIPIKRKHNTFNIETEQQSIPITIKGIPKSVYIIDTIKSFSAYHGTLRRYFESQPFMSYIGYFPSRNIVYTNKKVLHKAQSIFPVMYTIGKNLHFIDKNPIYNPKGFYLAFFDTVLPVPITRVSFTDIRPDTVIAYLIGRQKYPLFFVKDGIGYIASYEIDILARKFPDIFKSIMDNMVGLTAHYLVYAYPDKHIYNKEDIAKITIIAFPRARNCRVIRKIKSEPALYLNNYTSIYTFMPSQSDTVFIVKCGNAMDTVHILLSENKSINLIYNEKEFIKKILYETYTIKKGFSGSANESTPYYLLILFSLIFVWFLEKKRSLNN